MGRNQNKNKDNNFTDGRRRKVVNTPKPSINKKIKSPPLRFQVEIVPQVV